MNLSAERARLLLLPSRAALALSSGEKVPWRSATQIRKNRASPDSMIADASLSCEYTPTKSLQGKAGARAGRLLDLTNALLREIETLAGNQAFAETVRLQTLLRSDGIGLIQEIKRFEVNLIELALTQTNGHQARAARLLHVNP